MLLLCCPISPYDRIPDRFYIISMEFLSLSQMFLLTKRPSVAMSMKKHLFLQAKCGGTQSGLIKK